MKLRAARDVLLKPLQAVIGVVERRQTMPILSNVLLVARDGALAITATDLEVELVATAEVGVEVPGEITVSGRKLLDICRALPDGSEINISVAGEKLVVRSGKSKFNLATLPAAEFPSVEDIKAGQTIAVSQEVLGRLIEKTHFSMAQQDVRYYLNGMLLETSGKVLRAVATDGHRLALCEAEIDGAKLNQQPCAQQFVARRASADGACPARAANAGGSSRRRLRSACERRPIAGHVRVRRTVAGDVDAPAD
jgi:DNA polymerase-3 subunit beta